MTIEIGKTYAVSPKRKKCWIESESLQHDDNGVVIEITIVWRGGTTNVTPQSEEEVENLTLALDNGEDDEFFPHEFEENEFQMTWDGCGDDLTFHGERISELEEENLREGYYIDGYEYLEEAGYYSFDNEVTLCGELDIVEEGTDEQYNL
jgi:hypothetical protein